MDTGIEMETGTGGLEWARCRPGAMGGGTLTGTAATRLALALPSPEHLAPLQLKLRVHLLTAGHQRVQHVLGLLQLVQPALQLNLLLRALRMGGTRYYKR